VNCQNINFKLDTGSSVHILSKRKFKSLNTRITLQAPDSKLISYSGVTSNVLGKTCKYRTAQVTVDFYIVNSDASSLIGLQASIDFLLIKLTHDINCQNTQYMTIVSVMSEYGDLFMCVGIIPG
jgi:hypothetical protein